MSFLLATATFLLDPKRWADGFYMCGSDCEGGGESVTLLVLVGTWLEHHLVFQHDRDPKHSSRLKKSFLSKEGSDEVLGHMTWRLQ